MGKLFDQYFDVSEFNHLDKMDHEFLLYLGRFRHHLGIPMVVKGHSDYREGTGMHGQGRAIDCHLRSHHSYYEQAKMMISAQRQAGLGRIGFYTFWNNPGFHIDNKQEKLFWTCQTAGNYVYYSSPSEFLKCVKEFRLL